MAGKSAFMFGVIQSFLIMTFLFQNNEIANNYLFSTSESSTVCISEKWWCFKIKHILHFKQDTWSQMQSSPGP